jgi:SNF2 family DNA or RNA helicase
MMDTQDPNRPRALFINVEALSNGKSTKALDLALKFVQQRGALVVVDESTTIKGKSERTNAVIEIGTHAKAKRIMSGLWTPNGPMDLFYQCMFLDPNILGQKNFFTFQRRYATMIMQTNYQTGRKFPQVTGYKNTDELRDRVKPYSFRVLKKNCLDLEPKVYTSRDVELTAEQKKMLQEIKHFGHAGIGDTGAFVTTDMVIKRIIREIQIGCGYVMDDDRVLHEVPENRTKALIETLVEHRGKAIIWCPWLVPLKKVVAALEKEYGPEAVAQFHGGNTKTRGDEEKRFLSDPKCRFMCATQGAGMRGNTWVVADLEQRDQSEDRAHRLGQTNRVTYVDLIAQGTIENKVIKALRQKIDLATMINREGHRAWLI